MGLIEEMRRPFSLVEKHPTNVSEIVTKAIREVALPPKIEICRDDSLQTLPTVKADANLSEVFRVLIKNAYEAIGETGRIKIRGSVAGSEKVMIFLTDTGPGIPAEVRSNLFRLFYTTKGEQGGTGLGLWWVRTYLGRLGGSIELVPGETQGTTFMITLPIYVAEAEPQPAG
jgi:signal transduction histidine kinase